jgi:sulfide dehydrogenase cytochrome subunit
MMTGRKTPQPRTPPTWARSPTVLFGAVILAAMTWASVSARDLGGVGLADACTSCHGLGGRSHGYIPSIAGVEKTVLLRQLKAFRLQPTQPTQATIMNRIARAYTDSELEALADYFSAAPRQ